MTYQNIVKSHQQKFSSQSVENEFVYFAQLSL